MICSIPSKRDLVEVHRRVEREPREDRHLRGGVLAVDVVGRVGLGVAEPLRLGERVGVRRAGARHLAEDEVRRAVDDPVDPLDVRGRERLLQHADDRHDAGDGGLEAQLHAVLARASPTAPRRAGRAAACWRSRRACRRASRAARSRAPARSRRSARRSGRCRRGSRSKSPRERVSTPAISGRSPVTCAICVGALRQQLGEGRADRAVAEQADRKRRCGLSSDVTGGQIVVGLAAHDDARVAVLAEDHRRARDRRCSCWPSRGRRRRSRA